MNVSGKENSGCINYVIKKILKDLLDEIICITEGKKEWFRILCNIKVSNTFFYV
jgi:hypothetical protein